MVDPTGGDSVLVALRAARPDHDSDELAATSPAAQMLLDHLLAEPRASGLNDTPRWTAHRDRRRFAAASLGAAAVAAAGVVVGLALTGRAPSAEHNKVLGPSNSSNGSTLRLAGYSFQLPQGFTASSTSCGKPFTPPPGSHSVSVSPPPVVGGDSYARAASANGGCVEAALGTGYAANAQPVQFGSYQGYLWRTDSPVRGNQLSLYVVLPPSASANVGMDPGLGLFLDSTGLTEAQLEQIAESGLGN